MPDLSGSAPTDTARRALPLLWLAVILLGLNWPVMKQALEHVPPFWMVALRFVLSLPLLALAILWFSRRLPKLVIADAPVIIGVGLLQFAGQMTLITLALRVVDAGTATILIYSTPIWLLLIDLCIARGTVRISRLIIVLLSGMGCATIVWGSAQSGDWSGYAQILLAAVFWSISIRLIGAHPWRGPVLDALFWQAALASVICVPAACIMEGAVRTAFFAHPAIWFVIYVGPVATVGGFGLMIGAGRHVPAPAIALSSTAAPLIGVMASWLVLGEVLTPPVLIGGLLMLISLVLGAGPFRALRRWRRNHR